MDSWEKIKEAGDKNPCSGFYKAMFMHELYDAHIKLNRFCQDIFQTAYQNALKNSCYEHLRNKYCRVEFVRAEAYSSHPCMIIEFHFKGYLKEEAEFEDAGLENLNGSVPVNDKFRMYEYELVDYIN